MSLAAKIKEVLEAPLDHSSSVIVARRVLKGKKLTLSMIEELFSDPRLNLRPDMDLRELFGESPVVMKTTRKVVSPSATQQQILEFQDFVVETFLPRQPHACQKHEIVSNWVTFKSHLKSKNPIGNDDGTINEYHWKTYFIDALVRTGILEKVGNYHSTRYKLIPVK